MDPHLFARWNYDGFARRTFDLGWASASAERTGVITYCWFNGNPAAFCSEYVEQGFEDFLEHGAPLLDDPSEREPVRLADAVQRAIREHLLQRQPGASTFLTARIALPPQVRARDVTWRVDGALTAPQDLDGPPGAGLVARGPRLPEEVLNLVLEPGAHALGVALSLTGPDTATLQHQAAKPFTLARGEHRELVLEVSPDFTLREVVERWR